MRVVLPLEVAVEFSWDLVKMLQVVVDTCLMGIKLVAAHQFSPEPVVSGAVSCSRTCCSAKELAAWTAVFICLRLPALPIHSPGWLLQQSQSLLVV